MISEYINKINEKNEKALSVFITCGFPDIESSAQLVIDIYNAGADIVELGIPFSDPLADGHVIQQSSKAALANGTTVNTVLETAAMVKNKIDKPMILMGYSNPILNFGIGNFVKSAKNSGVNGLIVPDVPIEEYDDFFSNEFNELDTILLTTPASTEERIKIIDNKSNGFVYCVSVTGTTGERDSFSDEVLNNLKRTYSIITKNKMLIGFGISKPDDIRKFSSAGDGFIVGSAFIKRLINEGKESALSLVKELKLACR